MLTACGSSRSSESGPSEPSVEEPEGDAIDEESEEEAADDDGSGSDDPVVVGDGPIVAALELEQPDAETFLVRGTVPLPTDTFPSDATGVPLAVVDVDGTPLPSQVEITSRYPTDEMGADVVEVLARVQRDPNVATGERVRYDVIQSEHAALAPPPSPLSALADGPRSLDPQLLTLLNDPHSIELRTRDVFGHAYTHRPLAADHTRLRKYGRAQAEVTTYGALLPESPAGGAQATLPHLLGVHSYLSSTAGEAVLGLDLRFHNGFDGHDGSDPTDDALGKVYFESIELLLPAGWAVANAFDDPFVGAPYTEGARTVVPLVRPLDDGTLHTMPFQAQFHRRLALAPSDLLSRAQAIVRGEGRAFALRGSSPDTGEDLWSWWREDSSRYFPQALLVPDLSHVGAHSLRQTMRGRLAELAQHVEDGTGMGGYPVVDGVLGWAHPWGVSYGGMTGGDEIVFADGIETVCGASVAGYRYTQLVHRMHTSRQRAALYRLNGAPASVESWWQTGGPYGGYVPFNFYLTENGSGDPFGLGQAPKHQVQYVNSNGLAPVYEERLFEYQPHDLQHFVRYTRSPKVLAWLGNDSLAIDDLQMMAENFHLSFHTGANNSGGGLQQSGLQALIDRTNAEPGIGSTLGRGEGWGLDCAVAAYRLGEPEWRDAKRQWFEDVVEVSALAQSQCTGFFQSIVNIHGLGGQYRVRQHIEHVIYENALRSIVQAVVREANPNKDALAKSTLAFSYFASVHGMAWTPGAGAPWSWTAVAPLDDPDLPWCQPFELPDDWHTDDKEKYQLFTSLATAFWTSGNTLFLDRAQDVLGVPDLLQGLTDDGLKNIGNRAALLAVVQRLNGVL